MSRVVVVGAGIAGLTAALRLREAGHEVVLASKGIGGLQLSQGTVDVLGYLEGSRVDDPLGAIDTYGWKPGLHGPHPYEVIGSDATKAGVEYLARLLGEEYLVGDPHVNKCYPTAIVGVRPTNLVPPSMAAGECKDGARFMIVGLRQLKDFYPQLCAGNLNRTDLPGGGRVQARPVWVDYEVRENEIDTSALNYARALEDPQVLQGLADKVKAFLHEGESVGVPAVLGVHGSGVWQQFEQLVGAPVFEIPLPPPSVPGMRLNQQLTQLVKDKRVFLMLSAEVTGVSAEADRVTHVTVQVAGAAKEVAADAVVLAAGGFESGGLMMDSYGTISERALGLPVTAREIPDLIHGDYWGDQQALFSAGVAVDEAMHPLDEDGNVVYSNVHVVGGMIAGAMRWQEKSGEGIALGSMIRATDAIGTAATEEEK